MKLLSTLLFLGLTSSVYAQTGTLQGVVTDDNGIPMPGATVVIVDVEGKGTNTDVYGRFTIVGIPVGTYELQVRYIGYETGFRQVNIVSGTNTPLSIELIQGSTVGETIIVLGDGLRGQARALNQQRNAMNITNIVSADQVGRFPDDNIGDALKRIPGITMQGDQGEARNIVIRGMATQLNSVTLNG